MVALIVVPYFLQFRRRTIRDRVRKEEATRLGIDRPTAQFPFVDANHCIGCAACVKACPEGEILGVVGGTAVVINGLRCVGHGHCEEVCPVGAIEVGLGDLKSRRDVPLLDERLESSVPGLYVAGELAGLSLVRNAIVQGRQAMESIACQLEPTSDAVDESVLDVAIVGAGPAGLSAALTAAERNLRYLLIEKEASLGGSLLHYPRRKMVLTQPVELQPWGSLDRPEYQKEKLLEIFESLVRDTGLRVAFGYKIDRVQRDGEGLFRLQAGSHGFTARHVVLALGRRGSPRKLGVPGEDLAKVMYRLIDAESYRDRKILIVGGGDSAAEAAVGLARQRGNQVTISYRKSAFIRLKKKNLEMIEVLMTRRRIRVLFESSVRKIRDRTVAVSVRNNGASETIELENDYVFIFAGGVPPFGLLQETGVGFGGIENIPSRPSGQ